MYDNHLKQIKQFAKAYHIFVSVIVVVCMFALQFLALNVSAQVFNGDDSEYRLHMVVTECMVLIIGIMTVKRLSKVTCQHLGFVRYKAAKYFTWGILGSIAVASLVFLVNLLVHSIDITFVWQTDMVLSFIMLFVFYMVQAMFEEVMFRGYLLPQFAKVMGTFGAIIVTSGIFAILHYNNPCVTLIPFMNIFALGVMYCVLFYRTGRIWLIGAAHGMWNFMIGPVLGMNLSGMETPNLVLQSMPNVGYTIISGGRYGLEGSLVTTILCIAIIAWFLVVPIRETRM